LSPVRVCTFRSLAWTTPSCDLTFASSNERSFPSACSPPAMPWTPCGSAHDLHHTSLETAPASEGLAEAVVLQPGQGRKRPLSVVTQPTLVNSL
jgi:hypothetical protein